MSNEHYFQDEIRAIAKNVCMQQLPNSEMAGERSMLYAVKSGEQITQAELHDATRSFVALPRMIMPPKTIASFIRKHISQRRLPNHVETFSPATLLPPWIEGANLQWRPNATAQERRTHQLKFSRREVDGYLGYCVECPELPLSLIWMQELIDAYLLELRREIDKTNNDKAFELGSFHRHFATATNFVKFLAMGIYLHLPSDIHPRAAYDAIDQSTIDRSFQFLSDSGAFEFPLKPGYYRGQSKEPLLFTCPAEPFLRDLIVRQGALLPIIDSLRCSTNFPNSNSKKMLATKEYLKEVFASMKAIIDLQGIEGFDRLMTIG